MNRNLLLLICVFIWGLTTFLQRLSAERMSPILMQIIVGLGYALFVPILIKLLPSDYKWSIYSIILTVIATLLSILANLLLYSSLENNPTTGSSIMLVALYPVITLILSAIFLHEQFSIAKIIGVMVMIVGAFLINFG